MDLTRTLETPEGALAIYDRGQGQTVVFVHGTPSSSIEFEDAFGELSDMRCVSLDHLGFGRSDRRADADYSIKAHQARFAQAMDSLTLEDAVFVLTDFGTSIALPWLIANGDKVRGVVLANTFLWPAKGAMRLMLHFYASRFGRWLYRAMNLSARFLLPMAWGKKRNLTKALHGRYLAPFAKPSERHATSALPGELIGDTLSQMDPSALRAWPTRAVWGMADPLVGSGELDTWRKYLPELEVTEVEEAGHFVAHEAPEEIASAVRSLLA